MRIASLPLSLEYQSLCLLTTKWRAYLNLIDAIATTLNANQLSYEIICVDDGFWDGSPEMLKQLARTHTNLQAVVLRRNYGQTAAMAAGFKHAQGSVIVTLDADLQNDPARSSPTPSEVGGRLRFSEWLA